MTKSDPLGHSADKTSCNALGVRHGGRDASGLLMWVLSSAVRQIQVNGSGLISHLIFAYYCAEASCA